MLITVNPASVGGEYPEGLLRSIYRCPCATAGRVRHGNGEHCPRFRHFSYDFSGLGLDDALTVEDTLATHLDHVPVPHAGSVAAVGIHGLFGGSHRLHGSQGDRKSTRLNSSHL